MTQSLRRLVVFSDDWGRHPSSCQHIVARLRDRYRIDWFNTIGTRRPRLRLADMRRGWEKIREWLRPSDKAGQSPADPGSAPGPSPNLTIHSPVHWPGFGTSGERAVNRIILQRAVQAALASDPAPAAVITTLPIVADVARHMPDLPWIYYCVDDLATWPGLDRDALAAMEHELLRHVHGVISVSGTLRDRLRGLGRDSLLLTHGIDLDHWAEVRHRDLPAATRPVALFWGYADRRLDTDICLSIARSCTLRIIGPRGDLDPRLLASPGISWEPAVPYADLPRQAEQADVLVMPYADLPVTRSIQPLKLKEYLATGLPVVATPLPSNLEWADALDLSASAEAFAGLCVERAGRPLPPGQSAARRRLAEEGWDSKAQAFEAFISASRTEWQRSRTGRRAADAAHTAVSGAA